MNQVENSGEEFGNGVGQDIAQPYRAGSAEVPSAAADAAILMLARDAAVQTPVRGAAGPVPAGAGAGATAQITVMRRWRAPLGLAASLVLVVGIVSRVQVEEDAGTAPGAIPVTPPAVASSAPSAPASSAAAVPAAPANVLGSAPVSAPTGAPTSAPKSAPTNAPTSASATAPAEDALERKKERQEERRADVVTPAPVPFPAQGGRSATAMRDAAKPEQDARPKTLADSNESAAGAGVRKEPAAVAAAAPAEAQAGAGSAAREAAPLASSAPARASAPTVMGEARRDDPADLRAKGMVQKSAMPPALAALTEPTEIALTPEQWLRRIVDARRAGRHDEADASLARFILKHPAVVVPPEARRERP